MNILLEFIYNKNHYVIFENNKYIYLGKIDSDKYVKIDDSDKNILKEIVDIFIKDNFTKEQLQDKKIIVLKKKSMNVDFDGSCLIGLVFNESQYNNIINNCKQLYIKEKKNHSINHSIIYPAIICFIVILSILLLFSIRNSGHSRLYKKYEKVRNDNSVKLNNLELKMINIEKKAFVNVFEDEFLSFESFCDGYILSNQEKKNDLSMNIYRSSNCPYLAIVKSNSIAVDELRNLNLKSLNFDKSIDVDGIYNRYHINNLLDLIYNVVLYSDKNIEEKSSKRDITDGIFFESVKKIVIPYNKGSKRNMFIFYHGDNNGYAYITDKMIVIYTIFNDYDYKIIIQNNSDRLDIDMSKITDIMNTINIK